MEPFAAEPKEIVMSSELASAVIVGEYEHFFELVHNLVENAIKYGKDGGFVLLRPNNGVEAIAIEVADDGIGVPKAEQSRVFERFYRVDKIALAKDFGNRDSAYRSSNTSRCCTKAKFISPAKSAKARP
ncbi:MAG: sensor histidine kinase [Bacillus subtilis]|nr:sensor histidine kinase [Bacillus subtilis]